MKISALYFLQYPDAPPADPEIASSEARVEIGEGNPTVYAFDYTYAFQVHTLGFLEKELRINKKSFVINQATIIVPRFDPAVIKQAIESILSKIDRYALRIGR